MAGLLTEDERLVAATADVLDSMKGTLPNGFEGVLLHSSSLAASALVQLSGDELVSFATQYAGSMRIGIPDTTAAVISFTSDENVTRRKQLPGLENTTQHGLKVRWIWTDMKIDSGRTTVHTAGSIKRRAYTSMISVDLLRSRFDNDRSGYMLALNGEHMPGGYNSFGKSIRLDYDGVPDLQVDTDFTSSDMPTNWNYIHTKVIAELQTWQQFLIQAQNNPTDARIIAAFEG